MPRRRYSPKQRAAIWQREATNAYLEGKGRLPVCNLCGAPVRIGQAWDVSHAPEKARAFGGNKVGVGHRNKTADCLGNRGHGAKVVTPALAASNRKRAFHIGAAGPGLGRHPMAAGVRSGQSKTFHAGVVARRTQAQKHAATMAKRAILPPDAPEAAP